MPTSLIILLFLVGVASIALAIVALIFAYNAREISNKTRIEAKKLLNDVKWAFAGASQEASPSFQPDFPDQGNSEEDEEDEEDARFSDEPSSDEEYEQVTESEVKDELCSTWEEVPSEEPGDAPEVELVAEPEAELVAEPEAEPEAELVAEPEAELVAEPEAELVAEPEVELVAEPDSEYIQQMLLDFDQVNTDAGSLKSLVELSDFFNGSPNSKR